MGCTKLEKKWEPKESVDKVDLFDTFQQDTMDDPRTGSLTELTNPRGELKDIGHNMDDDTFLIHVMMSLPKEYREAVRDMKK